MVNFSIFNELSLPIESISAFDNFFQVLQKAREEGLEKIRMDREFAQYPEILPNTTFQQLLGQLRDRDKQRRLKSFISNGIAVIESPLIQEDESESDQLLENEYFYDGVSTKGGLACCDIWDSVVVSFENDIKWSNQYIEIRKVSMEQEKNIEIRNLSNLSHFSNHQDFFDRLNQFRKSKITRDNFFQKREEIFQNKIIICSEVEKQLRDIDTTIFNQALTILISIDKGRSLEEYNISKESNSVSQDPKLKNMRMFKINNKKEYFQKHIKNLPNGYRIHYFERDDKIYIGYIGKHLATKRYS
jgi:hypothetical protein